MNSVIRQARFVKIPVLLSLEGLKELFAELGDVTIVRTGAVLPSDAIFVDQTDFLKSYQAYIESFEKGLWPDRSLARPYFSTAWSAEESAFALEPVRPGFFVARAHEPAIQLRLHVLSYSSIDHTFHSMSLGKETIPWGVEFSYASLVQRGVEVESVSREAPNTQLFRKLQKWMRHHTNSVTFSGEGWQRPTHVRISPACKSWISNHPALDGMEVI